MDTPLAKTVAYSNVFSYPLTLVELRRWLLGACLDDAFFDLRTLKYAMDTTKYFYHGFISPYISGDAPAFAHVFADLQRSRRASYRITQNKLKRARRAAYFFPHIPFVRFVGVVNRVSWGIARETSDIDFFIVAAAGRLWFTRFLVTGFATLFGWRPTADDAQDAVCLSFFVSDDSLDIGGLRYQDQDIHFAFWLYQLMPLYDVGGVYEQIMERNRWLLSFFRAPRHRQYTRVRAPRSRVRIFFEWLLGGIIGEWLERSTRRYQTRILDQKYARLELPYPSAVVYDDNVIKLHWNDRRQHYFNVWQQHLKQLFP